MLNVLLISAIGMGLVFFAILLLWGMMALLVRVTSNKPQVEDATPPWQPAGNIPPAGFDEKRSKKKIAAVAVAAAMRIRRRQAAVLAVKNALALKQPLADHHSDLSKASNWQAVMRAAQREDRLRLFSRKPRRS